SCARRSAQISPANSERLAGGVAQISSTASGTVRLWRTRNELRKLSNAPHAKRCTNLQQRYNPFRAVEARRGNQADPLLMRLAPRCTARAESTTNNPAGIPLLTASTFAGCTVRAAGPRRRRGSSVAENRHGGLASIRRNANNRDVNSAPPFNS